MSELDLIPFEQYFYDFESEWRKAEQQMPCLQTFVESREERLPIECIVELAKIDLEHRLKRKSDFSVNQYWKWFDEIDLQEIRRELIQYELELRLKFSLLLEQPELLNRFASEDLQGLNPGSVDSDAEETLIGTLDESVGANTVSAWNEPLQAGSQVNQYTIEMMIGSGSFAQVYLATDNQLRRKVALKFLRPYLSKSEDARKRMLLEAQAVSSFQHNNIVPVFEIGKFKHHDFIVSRFVDGDTLDQTLLKQKFNVTESVQIASHLADALHHAHSRGVVHRDVKPANIMIENGEPLLLDFGLAHFSNASIHLTNAGDVVGTPAYMAPEQADGRAWQADPRTDVYGLGVVLYQLLVGKLPFFGSSAEVINQVINHEPASPRKLNPAIDRDIDTIVMKCLEKDPQDRYQNASALCDDLNCYLSGNSIIARPVGLLGRTVKWSKRRPVLASVSALLAMTIIFLVGMSSQFFQVLKQRDEAQSARAEAQTARTRLQAQLAIEAADAGRLAMQRGQMANAIEFFDRSIEMGFPDALDLRFKKLESLVVIRAMDKAVDELNLIVGDDTSSSTSPDGRTYLWKAELALDGFDQFGEAVPLFENANQFEFDEATNLYVDAMLSESSPAALENFRQALRQDPFHHRARRMLLTMLLSLGRFDDVLAESQIAVQLFPEDPEFTIFTALALAANDQMDQSVSALAELNFGSDESELWLELLHDVNEVTQDLVLFPGAFGYNETRHKRLATKFATQHFPWLRSRGWYFPPKIGIELADKSERLMQEFGMAISAADVFKTNKILRRLVEIHPEGSLLALQAERLSAEYNFRHSENLDDDSIDPELLKTALAAFDKSMNVPCVVSSVRETSQLGVIGTSLALFHRHKIDTESNQKRFVDAANRIDPKLLNTHRNLRAISVGLITIGAYDDAIRWCDRWLEVVGDKNLDAVWHRIVVDRWRERWLEVLQQSTEALKRFPDHEPLQGIHGRATAELKKELGLIE